MDFFSEGSSTHVIDDRRAGELLDTLLSQLRQRGPLRRVLLAPPDFSRFHSGVGALTCQLYERLKADAEVVVAPAVGTHEAMSAEEIERMFPGLPADRFRIHDCRSETVHLGDFPKTITKAITRGLLEGPIRIELNRSLVEEKWDAIISLGQLVPHEVIGIANHVKNILIGLGGKDLIAQSHWLGAVFGMEKIMGRAKSVVRQLLDEVAGQFIANLPVAYVLNVRGWDAAGKSVCRGLFAGDCDRCFRNGAELCRQTNIVQLDRPARKFVVHLDADTVQSTWIGNKAIYRTRMAIADGGELIVLAPGVREFHKDPAVDRLIRKHGYRGTPAIIDAVNNDPDLRGDLSAAAHLIHGSTEGRFHVTYCPGHLSKDEIESVGYRYDDVTAMQAKYQPAKLRPGWNTAAGEEFYFVPNPGQGLWVRSEPA